MMALVDGKMSIGRIMKLCGADVESARRLFARMHEWDHLLFRI